MTADQPTPDELELMRRLTEQKKMNEDTKKIPCRYCGRTVREVMKAREGRMEKEGEYGLGGFSEEDGKTVYTCIECQRTH